jgi:hypothetical protein
MGLILGFVDVNFNQLTIPLAKILQNKIRKGNCDKSPEKNINGTF